MSTRDYTRARALGTALRALWGALTRLEEREAQRERRLAAIEREVGLARDPRRVPATAAARRLGLSLASVRRLVETGHLRGAALRLPGRERSVWVVDAADLARFEAEAGTTGATGALTEPAAGRRGSDNGG